MTRQIALGYGAPSRADLENRIHALEVKVISLTHAVTLLARALETRALENGPPAGAAGDAELAKAARQARELVRTRHHNGATTGPAESEKPGKTKKSGKSGQQGKPAKPGGE